MTDTNQSDKEAVAKLTGAKAAMETALRRISTLEATLADQVNFMANMRKTVGTELYAQFYEAGAYKVRPFFSVLDDQINALKERL